MALFNCKRRRFNVGLESYTPHLFLWNCTAKGEHSQILRIVIDIKSCLC